MRRAAFLFVLFPHAADISLNTVERFLLVCSSMTAGCSVQPKLNKHTKKRKKPMEPNYSSKVVHLAW